MAKNKSSCPSFQKQSLALDVGTFARQGYWVLVWRLNYMEKILLGNSRSWQCNTKAVTFQGYQAVQFRSTNYCESVSPALMRVRVTGGALERQKLSIFAGGGHRPLLSPYPCKTIIFWGVVVLLALPCTCCRFHLHQSRLNGFTMVHAWWLTEFVLYCDWAFPYLFI